MTLYDVALAPFAEFGFMRRTLAGCLALALSCGPIGKILVIPARASRSVSYLFFLGKIG
jgi:ABC-type Mn2+/Zn2+ transport system permease subunit